MDISELFAPGLYKITCFKTNKIYIGESSNVLNRLGRHANDLEKNRHDCSELQNDFNRYGKRCFKFESLKLELNRTERKKRELNYINCLPLEQRYNQVVFSKTFPAKSVMIHGLFYSSLSQAARVLKESRTNLVRKCKSDHYKNYTFWQPEQQLKTPQKNYSFKKSTACFVDNVFYSSLSQAGKALKISHKTVKNRIESHKWPKYQYRTKNKK